ncbi:MAG: hypothetical protein ACI9OJ_001242 [Myxococcota bacterium]|jgi:hypothetical protein
MNRTLSVFIALLLLTATAAADRLPVRPAEEETTRRRGPDNDRMTRRPPHRGGSGASKELTEEEHRRKSQPIKVRIPTPSRCGATKSPKFRSQLLGLTNPNSDNFYIEVWGNKRTYYTLNDVYYFLRSNQEAYVTMFWIGPEGSVFIPFSNFKVEAHRDHKLDPANIIVEPVGFEQWRVIATREPHRLPCRVSDEDWVRAIDSIKAAGPWAAGRWDVMSKVRRKRGRLRR